MDAERVDDAAAQPDPKVQERTVDQPVSPTRATIGAMATQSRMSNRGRHEKDAMTDKAGSAAPSTTSSERGPQAPAAPGIKCPKCGGEMRTYARGGLTLELCEDCRGIFLDVGELERLIDVEGGGWSGVVTAAIDPRR